MRSNNGHRRVRKRLRLKYYDYSSVGLYFVTICTKDRGCYFGNITKGVMELNDAGQIVKSVWDELTVKFPHIESDQFIIMPNHIHGIIALVGAQFIAPASQFIAPAAESISPTYDSNNKAGAMNRAPTVGHIVRAFKAKSTRLIHLSGMISFA